MFTGLRLGWRDGVRTLWRFRATTALAVGILALAMAAATVTFSVVDAVVLRPLPYPQPDRLVSIFGSTPKNPRDMLQSVHDYFSWREHAVTLESVGAWSARTANLKLAGSTQEITIGLVTADLFNVLKVQPILGRPFGPEREERGQDNVAVIGFDAWKRYFGGAADVIGRPLSISGRQVAVVAVMPRGFVFPVTSRLTHKSEAIEVSLPLTSTSEQRTFSQGRGLARGWQVIGRLRDGVTVQQAAADVERLTGALAAQHPQLYGPWQVRVDRLRDVMTGRVRHWMLLVLLAVTLLLVVACANVANLLLAQASRRARDLAVRASLGATRAQITQNLLIESLLLSITASVLGIVLAALALDVVVSMLPPEIPRAGDIGLNARVLGLAIAASIATAFGFGAVPARQAGRLDLVEVLKDGSSSSAGPTGVRWRSALLVGQVAVVTLLLVGTTLLVGSFLRAIRTDLGFKKENLVGVQLMPALSSPSKETTDRLMDDFFRGAATELGAVPGVERVAMLASGQLPLYQGSATTRLSVPTRGDALSAEMRRVSPEYFDTAGIRLLTGRNFTSMDQQQQVLVLDDTAARHLFPDGNAVGGRVTMFGLGEMSVIGVVANVRLLGPEGVVQPQVYRLLDDVAYTRVLLARTSVPPQDIVPIIQARLAAVMPKGSARFTVDVVEKRFEELTADRRFSARVMIIFGALALAIGIVGIYGVTAATVSQQTRQLAIRIALGADANRVVWAVTAATGRLVLLGAAIGLFAAAVASSWVRPFTFGVTPTDLIPYLVPFGALLVIGFIGAILPAVRASRLDPLLVLRGD